MPMRQLSVRSVPVGEPCPSSSDSELNQLIKRGNRNLGINCWASCVTKAMQAVWLSC